MNYGIYRVIIPVVDTADPHPGNILVCLQKPGRERADIEMKNFQQPVGSIVPGLLDYGMTVR
jgi:predicted unusual protein kinase regulating ubiquinone biosynthesis (AarF/ABC1/UbiB family)